MKKTLLWVWEDAVSIFFPNIPHKFNPRHEIKQTDSKEGESRQISSEPQDQKSDDGWLPGLLVFLIFDFLSMYLRIRLESLAFRKERNRQFSNGNKSLSSVAQGLEKGHPMRQKIFRQQPLVC